LTLLAAFSLWWQKNVIAGPWVIVLLSVTFALLFILGACSAAFKRRLKDLRESEKEGQEADGLDRALQHPGRSGQPTV
jgi:hypothetical protein